MAPHAQPGLVAYLVPLVAIAMVMLRNSRERKLRIERMWIAPAVVLAMTALVMAQQPPPEATELAIDAAALALGAAAGWWRGRLTHISVDPQSHALTSRTSPLGMLLILGLFALRYALRRVGAAGALHVSLLQLTDVLMLLAVGIVCAQRLEMALRATRLLRAARSR
jgi:hypothetical protein